MPYRFDLEQAVSAWRRPLEHNRAFSAEDVEELEGSLRDRMAALAAQGLSEEEAFGEALRRMGPYGRAETEYRKVYWGKVRRQRQLASALVWRLSMLENYLKVAARTLLRQKGYAFINVAGLTVGLACSFFILLWVTDERRVDRLHESGDRIYRVLRNETNNAEVFTRGATPGVLGPRLTADYPEIENATYVWEGRDFLVFHGGRSFREQGRYVSPDFFEVFTFPLVQGDLATALAAENSVVLSETLARKLFGAGWQDSLVIGRTLDLDHDEDFTVTAVARDAPDHSTIRFDLLLPIQEFFAENDWATQWGGNAFPLYVRLSAGASAAEVEAKIAGVLEAHDPYSRGEVLFLQPFEETYLYDRFENGVVAGGRIDLVRIFSVVAAFLLAIAAINFMNMATARSTQRSKEIGVRKAIGAGRPSLTTQFMAETLLLAFLSLVLALTLVLGLLPVFNQLTGKHILATELSPVFLVSALGIALGTGLLAGTYPAFYLSSFHPAAVLRGTFRQKPGEARMRKGLVVFQFAVSTLIIVCTTAVYLQIRFILERDLGLDRGNVVSFELEGAARAQYETFRQELLKRPGIVNVSASSGSPLFIDRSTSSPTWAGKDPQDETEFSLLDVSYDFVETMRMELIAGRSHSREFGADSAGFVINERAAEVMKTRNPVGERLNLFGSPGLVIGVVKDFHMSDMSGPVAPTLIRLAPANAGRVWVRAEPERTQEALAGVEALHERFNPGYPFEYEFLDKEYEAMYRSVLVTGRLANVFAVIATLVSCLGLFGLAAFTAEQRTKEIGVRKALGASAAGIVALLSQDFLKLVALAFLLAVPVAYFVTGRWLENFAYRVGLSAWIFVLAGALVLGIALLAVSYQAIRAALADPVKSLRYE